MRLKLVVDNPNPRTFDRKGSFEIGLKLDKTLGSRLFFFISGCTAACLKAAGTEPDIREELISWITQGPSVLKTSLKRRGGTVSRGQHEGLNWLIISVKLDKETGSKCSKKTWHNDETAGSISEGESNDLTVEILSVKNLRNFSQSLKDGTTLFELQGFIREFRVLKRNWGLWLLFRNKIR